MGFMDIFKKMFVSNSQIKDIININDMVQIPTREYFKDNQEVINLIDKYKNEYIKLLSDKNLLLSRELSFDNIYDEVRMYIDLLLRICIRDDEVIDNSIDIENKNINMIIQMTKLKLYLNSFYELDRDVMTRLISLREVMNEHKWLYIRNRNVINEEINNLSSIIVMFMSQKMAIEKEIDAYFKEIEVQTITDNLSVNKKDKLKLDELLEMAKELIPERVDYINQLEVSDLIKTAYLEKEIEIYVYKNKNAVDSLKEELQLLDKEEKNVQNKDKLVERIKKLENQYKLFYKYGRKVITDDDMYDLYRVKFDIKSITSWSLPFQPLNYGYNEFEIEVYKDIVMKKTEKILHGENENVRKNFGNNSNKAIRLISKKLKSSSGDIYDFESILRLELRFLLAFDREDGFESYLKNLLRYRFDIGVNYWSDVFDWEFEIPMDTKYYVFLSQNYEYYADLYKLYCLYEKELRKRVEYRLPDGLVKVNIPPKYTNDIIEKIAEDAIDKKVIFPSSLKEISGDLFYKDDVLDVELNDGLISVGKGTLSRLKCNSLTIPASLKHIEFDDIVKSVHILVFKDYENSKILTNNLEVMKMIKSFFYILRGNIIEGEMIEDDKIELLVDSSLDKIVLLDKNGDLFKEINIKSMLFSIGIVPFTSGNYLKKYELSYSDVENIKMKLISQVFPCKIKDGFKNKFKKRKKIKNR